MFASRDTYGRWWLRCVVTGPGALVGLLLWLGAVQPGAQEIDCTGRRGCR